MSAADFLPAPVRRYFIERRTPDSGPDMTPEEVSTIGVPIDVVPSDNYQVFERTHLPNVRPARSQTVVFFSPMGAWGADDFIQPSHQPPPQITQARGRFDTGPDRQNIARPAPIAYGSLVPEADTPLYGLDY